MRTLMRRLSALLLSVGVALILGGCAGAAPLVNGANYVSAMLDQTQRAGTSISTLSSLVGNPQLADATWRQQVNQEIAALRAMASEARALTPPQALAGPHQRYLDALTQLDQTLTTVEGAMGAGDLARLRESVPLLAEVEVLLTAAQERIGAGGQ
jgi:hypothetical protein